MENPVAKPPKTKFDPASVKARKVATLAAKHSNTERPKGHLRTIKPRMNCRAMPQATWRHLTCEQSNLKHLVIISYSFIVYLRIYFKCYSPAEKKKNKTLSKKDFFKPLKYVCFNDLPNTEICSNMVTTQKNVWKNLKNSYQDSSDLKWPITYGATIENKFNKCEEKKREEWLHCNIQKKGKIGQRWLFEWDFRNMKGHGKKLKKANCRR